MIEPAIKDGQENGTIAAERSPMELAASLSRFVLVECHTYQHQPPGQEPRRTFDELAAAVANTCLDGLERA